MLDFRYHALSLVAVFLALAIGIVLGVTIGDSLVSEADQTCATRCATTSPKRASRFASSRIWAPTARRS